MSDTYEELADAKENLNAAEKRLAEARRKVSCIENNARKELSVGRNIPCKAGLLPNGKVVVQVWRESGADRIYTVDPVTLNEYGCVQPKDVLGY